MGMEALGKQSPEPSIQPSSSIMTITIMTTIASTVTSMTLITIIVAHVI